MAPRKTPLPKKSVLQEPPLKPLKKAIPPPDNPMLRYQAEVAAREGENKERKQMALLRLQALEQTKKMVADGVNDKSDNKPRVDEQR